MTRLLIHVEGQTEEEFVNELLVDHLCGYGFTGVSARLLGNSRKRKNRGGICPWNSVHKDISNHLKSDGGAYATMLVDYYALPNDWPGRNGNHATQISEMSSLITNGLSDNFRDLYGEEMASRFIPFVFMHEFEGLLFSDPKQMAMGMARSDLEAELQNVRDQFETPEHINDSPQTAPSKRIQTLIPNYQKPLLGNLAAIEVSLDTMKQECPIFNSWLITLERLGQS